MSDKELLELAAKAAGVEYDDEASIQKPGVKVWWGLWRKYEGDPGEYARRYWNPLTDDGDALRLAVRLGISIEVPDPEKLVRSHSPVVDAQQEGCVTATIYGNGYRFSAPHLKRWHLTLYWVSMVEFERIANCRDESLIQFWRANNPENFENAYTATRRAIVRAAAEIGKASA